MSSSDSEDFELPPDLLERERQLVERNRQLEERRKALLRSTSLTAEIEIDDDRVEEEEKSVSDGEIFEVEVPPNPEEVVFEPAPDPLPGLRAALHRLIEELSALELQTTEAERDRLQCEESIVELQRDLRTLRADRDKHSQDTLTLQQSLTAANEKNAQLKAQLSNARLDRITRNNQRNEIHQKQTQLEAKLRKQRSIASSLQHQLNTAENPNNVNTRMNAQKISLQHTLQQEQKTLRALHQLLSDIRRVSSQEDRLYDHIQSAKQSPPNPQSFKTALSQLH